jgi:serine/threonine-protein kinase
MTDQAVGQSSSAGTTAGEAAVASVSPGWPIAEAVTTVVPVVAAHPVPLPSYPDSGIPAARVASFVAAVALVVAAAAALVWLVTRPPLVAIPMVQGARADYAVERLHLLGFRTMVIREPTVFARGTVVSQEPAAGDQVERGGRVTLLVSAGLQTVSVPNVVGLTLARARAVLAKTHLTLSLDGGGAALGARVTSQVVEPGSTAIRGAAIDIRVAARR